MNIYQKLSKARVLIQGMNIKQSGQNKFAGYNYFELSDILPVVNKIGDELGFVCVVSFGPIVAQLKVIDCEKPDAWICFDSPMSTASLKGCHEVQNLGAVETYIKRYLYQNAFEIVEHDALNGTHNPNEKPEAKNPTIDLSSWKERIKKVNNYIGLSVIASDLKKSNLPDSDKSILRQEYEIRKRELSPPPVES
jgi:hypothetical protein